MSYKGKFSPKHPEKYSGDAAKIVFRSLMELRAMKYFDENSNILAWNSEEVIVPYRSKVDGRMHRYFPDFVIAFKDETTGSVRTIMIEVKPKAQTLPPKQKKRNTSKYIYEVKRWGVNTSKWEAAETFCESRGWEFLFLTEQQLS